MELKSLSKNVLLLIMLVMAGIFVGTLLASLLIQPILGYDLMNNIQLLDVKNSSIETSRVLKFYQFFQAFFSFVVPAHLFAKLKSKNDDSLDASAYLGFKKTSMMHIILAILLIVFSSPLISFLSEVNANIIFSDSLKSVENYFKDLESQAESLTKVFLMYNSIGDIILNFFIIGLLAAVSEEMLFRGVLQKLFIDHSKNILFSILITAFIFSAFHLQFYGLIPRFVLGVLLGYAYYLSGSIWVPIIMHFINNSVAVLFYILYNKGLSGIDPNENEYFGILGLIISLISSIIIIWYWKKNSHKV